LTHFYRADKVTPYFKRRMALTETQQAIEQLRRAERPVIAFRKEWTPDAAASAVGLASVLKSLGKSPEIVCDGFAPPAHLDFLPRLKEVRPEMSALRRFRITVDVSKNKVGELSYEAKDGFLYIYLTPKSGAFDSSHLATGTTDWHHDLIVTIDTPDTASLGGLAESSGDFFFRSPILNIDHSPANELYGAVNRVDPTATSCGEMLFHLFKEMGVAIDKALATTLLTGMVSKTRSFKSGSITPRALGAASELVALGADRDLIVKSLYRTKTISALRLWGRALARMKHDPTHRIVSSLLTRQDFVLAGADECDLADIIEELITASPEAETVALIYEREGGEVCCVVRNDFRRNADALTAPWNGAGGKVQSRCFIKGKSITDIEKEVLEHLRATLAGA